MAKLSYAFVDREPLRRLGAELSMHYLRSLLLSEDQGQGGFVFDWQLEATAEERRLLVEAGLWKPAAKGVRVQGFDSVATKPMGTAQRRSQAGKAGANSRWAKPTAYTPKTAPICAPPANHIPDAKEMVPPQAETTVVVIQSPAAPKPIVPMMGEPTGYLSDIPNQHCNPLDREMEARAGKALQALQDMGCSWAIHGCNVDAVVDAVHRLHRENAALDLTEQLRRLLALKEKGNKYARKTVAELLASKARLKPWPSGDWWPMMLDAWEVMDEAPTQNHVKARKQREHGYDPSEDLRRKTTKDEELGF